MDNNKKYWFFGSKLNTALLLVLIVLMVIALKWMYQNKEAYLPISSQEEISEEVPGIFLSKLIKGKEIELTINGCTNKDVGFLYKVTSKLNGIGTSFYDKKGHKIAQYTMYPPDANNSKYLALNAGIVEGSCNIVFNKDYGTGAVIDTYNILNYPQ